MLFFGKKSSKPDSDKLTSARIDELEHRIEGRLEYLTAIHTDTARRVGKIEATGEELQLQLEEVSAFLQDEDQTSNLIASQIAILDIIEHFYRFAQAGSPLYDQAQMMWLTATKAATDVGIKGIDDVGMLLDSARHEAKGTDNDINLPPGQITKTISCGYMYNGDILRKALVVVNRAPGE